MSPAGDHYHELISDVSGLSVNKIECQQTN